MHPPFPHEKETIELISPETRPTSQLWPLLRELGFSMDGGYWGLQRIGEVPNGQSDNFGSLSLYHAEEELDLYLEETVYTEESVAVELDSVTVWLDEEEAEGIAYWDRIEISYLLASLPQDQIEPFLRAVEALSEVLELPMLYEGKATTKKELSKKFYAYCAYLEEEYGGAGSMTIRHFIELHYLGI